MEQTIYPTIHARSRMEISLMDLRTLLLVIMLAVCSSCSTLPEPTGAIKCKIIPMIEGEQLLVIELDNSARLTEKNLSVSHSVQHDDNAFAVVVEGSYGGSGCGSVTRNNEIRFLISGNQLVIRCLITIYSNKEVRTIFVSRAGAPIRHELVTKPGDNYLVRGS